MPSVPPFLFTLYFKIYIRNQKGVDNKFFITLAILVSFLAGDN
ncbi:hypothetical protein NEOC65_002196 [Neochlamydia sp. AcF65]|nr:hypothetical protein [Neochlamydia sp. AcF65]MBS4170778.1 hypothetical protein [Neochlamydia sp. AcF95]